MNGYVLIMYQPNSIVPPTLVNPWDLSQRVQLRLDFPKSLDGLKAVVVEDISFLRRVELESVLYLAEKGSESSIRVVPIQLVVNWGLRMMDQVSFHLGSVNGSSGVAIIDSVNGNPNQRETRARPYYDQLRLEKGPLVHREPIERVEELVANPPERMTEAQVVSLRSGGILLMRIFSYLAPLLRGACALVQGQPKSGKSFAMRMLLYYLIWIVLEEEPRSRVVILAISERPDEYDEFVSLKRASDRVELFGTTDEDIPLTKAEWISFCALERVYRSLELGCDVFFVMDSLTRLSEAISINSSRSDRGEGKITGGHSPQGVVKPRAYLAVRGRLVNHPLQPVCTVVATGLSNTRNMWWDVPTTYMQGSSNLDWVFTDAAIGWPKIYVTGGFTSARNLEAADLTPEERWFIAQLRERMNRAGTDERGRPDPARATEFLVRTFARSTPRQVMTEWVRERRKQELCNMFQLSLPTADVLVSLWDLTPDQAKKLFTDGLLEAMAISDLREAEVTKAKMAEYFEGRLDLVKLLADYRREWSNAAYLAALNEQNRRQGREERETSLAPATVNPLREVGITASVLKSLLNRGFDFKLIRQEVQDGATVQNILERLEKKQEPVKKEEVGV